MRWAVIALLLSASLAGCIGADEEAAPASTGSPEEGAPELQAWSTYLQALQAGQDPAAPTPVDPGVEGERVVVAVIDSGVNPFHETFARPSLQAPGTLPAAAVDADTGQPPVYVPIHEASKVEQGAWLPNALEPHTLYRLAGTNLLFHSVLDEVETLDLTGHGTATAGTVTQAAPETIVLVVQTDSAHLAEAVNWTVAQPWIDIINLSWGCPANCLHGYPLYATGDLPGEADEVPPLTKAAWQQGKLVVASAGNDPTAHQTDPMDGPPWVIAVGGADVHRGGEVATASKAADVVSNYTVMAPSQQGTDGTEPVSGTSFAAPTVAGTLASTLLDLRHRANHTGGIQEGALLAAPEGAVTNAAVRDAMNHTAVYWNTTGYQPTAEDANDDPARLGTPINPLAPWAQMGWGYVGPHLAGQIGQDVWDGTLDEKPQAAQDHMTGLHQARTQLWR